jgi:class 3 adenylate cyclase
LTRKTVAQEVVHILSALFSRFDRLCDAAGVTKIKTIGDAYMVAAGLPEPMDDHVAVTADLALSMQQEAALLTTELREPLSLRVGMHTGALVAGVVGTRRLAYDLWGDTVNVAAHMESSSVAGSIQVSRSVYERLKDRYLFERRGEFYVRGAGQIETYLLKGRRR